MDSFECLHLRIFLDEICLLSEMIKNEALRVPHAEQVKRISALAVLQIEVGVNPLHEYFEQIGRRETHEEVLDPPLFVVFIILVHTWLRYYEFGICTYLYQVVDSLDQKLLMSEIVSECG